MEMVLFQAQLFTLILHAHNTCGGRSTCHLLMVPTVDQQTFLSCELRTAHTDTILQTVDIVFVCFILRGLVLGEVISVADLRW